MRYKNLLYNTWAKLHIAFIVLVCCYSAYTKYCRFYKVKQNKAVIAAGSAVLYNTPMFVYGNVTGSGSGYGFFAPSIRSNGIIVGECNGQKIMPQFKSFEGAVRFNSLSTAITDYLLSGDEDSTVTGVNKTGVAYYDLILKSIGVNTYRQNNCTQDSFFISYNIISFPELKEYRNGDHEYSLVKVKEMKLKLK